MLAIIMVLALVTPYKLLDLPEEILRLIFTHLEDDILYLKLRVVCHQLKIHVENFVELGMY